MNEAREIIDAGKYVKIYPGVDGNRGGILHLRSADRVLKLAARHLSFYFHRWPP